MSNVLDNGAVLPSGILGVNFTSHLEGFKKTFQNPYLRVGVITSTYEIDSPNNFTKFSNLKDGLRSVYLWL